VHQPYLSKLSAKSSKALETMTGTAAATLPTSSSVCMIFLMRA